MTFMMYEKQQKIVMRNL